MRVRKVYVQSEAAEDLEEGRIFYNRRQAGIGEYFLDCLYADIESLRFYAGIHVKHLGFYRALSKRFPFAIYYEIDEEQDFVMVVAILDMRRDPAWVREKLRK